MANEKNANTTTVGVVLEESDLEYLEAMRLMFPRADGNPAGISEVVRAIIRQHRDKIGLHQREA